MKYLLQVGSIYLTFTFQFCLWLNMWIRLKITLNNYVISSSTNLVTPSFTIYRYLIGVCGCWRKWVAAFDSLSCDFLLKILQICGVPEELSVMVRQLYLHRHPQCGASRFFPVNCIIDHLMRRLLCRCNVMVVTLYIIIVYIYYNVTIDHDVVYQ